MKLKKKLTALFSFLLLSIFLLTGCSPEVEDLATDVLTGIITEMEAETDAEVVELPGVEETDSSQTENAFDEETTPEETVETDKSLEVLEESNEPTISEDGTYTSKDEVSAYIHEYGHLPSNFITKKEARNLGWVSSEGNLWEVAPGMSIGGDYFGNYEGNLPEAKGRDYYECDIDTDGSYRGAKRIVFSDDGLIYYTEDHYETFELLYGEE